MAGQIMQMYWREGVGTLNLLFMYRFLLHALNLASIYTELLS